MKRIYVAGPMTGLPGQNRPAFMHAAQALRAIGHMVTNPAELNTDPEQSWTDCMRVDIRALCLCDTIAYLPGWEDSNGAHLELYVAHQLGIKVMRLESLL